MTLDIREHAVTAFPVQILDLLLEKTVVVHEYSHSVAPFAAAAMLGAKTRCSPTADRPGIRHGKLPQGCCRLSRRTRSRTPIEP